MVSYITCLECGNRKERPEKFCDLILPIKSFTGGTFKSIQDSIDFLTTPETLDGNNLYACEVCDAMTMAVKGQSFGKY